MASWLLAHALCIILLAFGPAASSSLLPPLPVKAAYWYYASSFDPSLIHASVLTHVIYAFVDLDNSSFSVCPPLDPHHHIQTFSHAVRTTNPAVKTLVSVGGGNSDAAAFSAMASAATSRDVFIRSSIELARKYGFDGLDLDWEFPQDDSDMANLGLLFSEWRTAVLAENSTAPLLLTAAVKFNVTVLYGGAGTYPVQVISENLDWLNIMCFDYHGSWEPKQTGQHSALYDSNPGQHVTTNYGISQWLGAGLPPTRAVLGLAMYGRTWYLQDSSENGVGAPALSAGPKSGVYTYDEVKQFANKTQAVCRNDGVTKSAYCYGNTSAGTLWVGYDDESTVAVKVAYLKSKKMRGYFFWSLGSDREGDLSKQAFLSLEATTISDRKSAAPSNSRTET